MALSLPTKSHRSPQSPSRFSTKRSSTTQTHVWLLAAIALVVAAGLASVSFAAVKKVAYPEVKVTLSTAYKPDAAFEKMRAAFAAAVAKKDVAALSALVAPTFLWTIGGRPADEMDLGRDAIYNFKVVFGFRALGKDVDGGVDDGPYWDALAGFVDDPTYYAANDAGNLVCGPIAADLVDDDILEQARQKIETGDDGSDWYFTLANTDVTKAPGDTGPPVAKVGTVALPLLSVYPPAKEGQPETPPTHIEVLLPSGKSGFVQVAAVRALSTDHLCYAKTPSGDWKVAAIDQPEQ
jgi:hypothetical protein